MKAFSFILLMLFACSPAWAQLIDRDSLEKQKQYYNTDTALKEAAQVYCLNVWDYSQKEPVSDKIGQLKNLNRLLISNKRYDKMPEAISSLSYLQELGIFESPSLDMQALFKQLAPLKHLVYLDVSRMNTVAYEGTNKINLEGIGVLKNLEYLSVEYDHLDSLPAEVCGLRKLKVLNIASTGLAGLPEHIGELKNLEMLYAGNAKEGEGNPIKILPQSFAKLVNLRMLNLNGNPMDLEKMFIVLARLPRLESLDLSMMELDSIPETIGDLSNLKDLTLYYGGIKNLPSSIARLKNLKTLDLAGNQIDEEERKKIRAWLPQTTITF